MCKKTNYKSSNVRIDKCIRPFIEWFNEKHLSYASCCGHGKYHLTVVIKEKNVFKELISQIIMPRKRRFYKRDKKGYYYIPEVEEYYKQIERKQYLQK